MHVRSFNGNLSFHVIARFYSTDRFHVLADKLDNVFNNHSIEDCQFLGRLIPCRFLNSSIFINNIDLKKYDIKKLYSYDCMFNGTMRRNYSISGTEFCINFIKPYLDKIDSIVGCIAFSDLNS